MKQLAVFVNKGYPETDTITFLGEIHAIHSHTPLSLIIAPENIPDTLFTALLMWCGDNNVAQVYLKPHFMEAPHAEYDVKDYFTRAKQVLDNADECRIFVGRDKLERSNSWAYKYCKEIEIPVVIVPSA